MTQAQRLQNAVPQKRARTSYFCVWPHSCKKGMKMASTKGGKGRLHWEERGLMKHMEGERGVYN